MTHDPLASSLVVRSVVGETPRPRVERMLEALDNAARIGTAEALCGRFVVDLGDASADLVVDELRGRFGHLDFVDGPTEHDSGYVVTIAPGAVVDARALWRMLAVLAEQEVDAVAARQLPIETPDAAPEVPALVMTRPGADATTPVVLPSAVVFTGERWPLEPAPDDEQPSGPTPTAQWLAGLAELGTRTGWDVSVAPPYDQEPGRPFLSVVMRTQGRRPQEFREALLGLAAQTSDDFEVLVVPHKTDDDERRLVEQLVDEQPSSFRSRIRVLPLDHGGRAAPLNLGLEQARGRYVGIVDDDDLVLEHWVEAFARVEQSRPGSVLRSMVLVQQMETAPAYGQTGLRASGPILNFYARRFSLVQHLAANQSPTLGWVVPRWLVDGGLRFDDSMTTTEDWELLLRATELAGVADTEEATSIYRRYAERESSRTLHPEEEWQANQAEIERRTDGRPLLLPAGETREVRRMYLRLRELERAAAEQRRELRRASKRVARLRAEVITLREQVREQADEPVRRSVWRRRGRDEQ